MTKTSPVSLRLKPQLNDQIAALAALLDRPKSWVIEQAIEDFMAVQSWQLAAIAEGIAAADAGRGIAHEDIAAWVHSWDERDELPAPRCG
jgi:predicted transcriptional regulator